MDKGELMHTLYVRRLGKLAGLLVVGLVLVGAIALAKPSVTQAGSDDQEDVSAFITLKPKPKPGTPSQNVAACVQRSIDKCIDNRVIEGTPRDRAKAACEKIKWLYELGCKGKLPTPLNAGGTTAD
jgi:hypothetical protein